MDSNRLKYFLVVSETESIRKAAEVLHLSPAALSKAIKQLEDETNSKLITPAGRGITITDAGRELARAGQPLIEGLEKLKLQLKEKRKPIHLIEKPIRIGSFEMFTTHFLSHLLEHVAGNRSMLLFKALAGDIEGKLLNHDIDYGFTYIPIPTIGIYHQQITFVDMKIFGLPHAFDNIPFDEIPFAVPMQPIIGAPSKVQGLDGWPEGKINRFIKYRVNVMESALELCRQGKAMVFLPAFIVKYHNRTIKDEYNLQPYPFPKGMSPQKQTVYLVKRKSDPNDDVTEKIIHTLKTYCK